MENHPELDAHSKKNPSDIPGDTGTIAPNDCEEDADIERIRTEIQSLNSKVTELMSKIGEHYSQSFLTEGHCDPELKDIFDDISEHTEKITGFEQDMLTAKNVICTSCGKEENVSVKVCSSCGTLLDDKTIEQSEHLEEENCGICPLCGENLEDDAIFCYTCGARIKI